MTTIEMQMAAKSKLRANSPSLTFRSYAQSNTFHERGKGNISVQSERMASVQHFMYNEEKQKKWNSYSIQGYVPNISEKTKHSVSQSCAGPS